MRSIISIEICYDIQKNIKAKSFEFFQLTDYNCMEIEQLKNIWQNFDYTEKKLIIIQSNITNIYEQIHIFPKDVIIWKSDPVQPLVFSLKNKKNIDSINLIETYNNKQIKTILFQYSKEGKQRLYLRLKEINNKVENYNANKLIRELKSKVFIFDKAPYQYMFIEYQNLFEYES